MHCDKNIHIVNLKMEGPDKANSPPAAQDDDDT